ncbi:MAG: hypothetical protein R3B96_14840 [Pirellulaceae bacterium]
MSSLSIVGGCVRQVSWLGVATLGIALLLFQGTVASGGYSLRSHRGGSRLAAPLTDEDVAAAKADLQSALDRLNDQLTRNGDEIRDGWRLYLRWEEIDAQVAAPSPNLAVLVEVRDSMRRRHPGLELPAFQNLRAELTAFIGLMTYAQVPDQVGAYNALLDQLAALDAEAQSAPTASNYSLMGRIADRLENAHQAPGVVEFLRARYGSPNIVARVSADFIESNSERAVDDTRPVSEVILGTQQRGTARTVGTITVRPTANAQRAELIATLRGTSTGANVGTRSLGRNTLVINSTSDSTLEARKRLFLTPSGIESCPTTTEACTRSTILSICAPRLLSRLVTKQVYKSKPEAEAIAASRLERRTSDSFDEQFADAVAENRASMQDEVRSPLQRLDAAPRQWRSWTTNQAMMLEALQANGEQLGAPSAHPELDATADIAMALHQTGINNLAEAVFGGKRVTDRQVAEWVEVGSGDLPRELRIAQDNRWAIVFAPYQPITVEFGDGTLTARLRGTSFERAEETLNELIEISATYAVVRTEQGVRLTRQGDVEVTFPGREQLNIERRGIRTFMQEKFQALFPEERETEGIRFPGRFADRAPLKLAQFELQGGWLSLSWQQTEPLAADETEGEVALSTN